jgi:tRNA U34 5-methylaminomethyl-2-thiouridine-forming methyltransferase MnmC
MLLEVKVTGDGSHTLYRPDLNEHYHSTFGAIRESQHVFIEAGLSHVLESPSSGQAVRILEVGFGTGLNALLAQAEAERSGWRVEYTGIEAFPLDEGTIGMLNYPKRFGSVDLSPVYNAICTAAWGEPTDISPHFRLHKVHGSIMDFEPDSGTTDLVFFDAFGPDVQPEIWSEAVFLKLGSALRPGGVLVTYSVKGTVVRTLKSAGFSIEKLNGPPGKRHILRATRSTS